MSLTVTAALSLAKPNPSPTGRGEAVIARPIGAISSARRDRSQRSGTDTRRLHPSPIQRCGNAPMGILTLQSHRAGQYPPHMSTSSHRRSGIVGVVAGVVTLLLAIGPVAALLLPVASLGPKTGLAGSEITVTVSQYSPDIAIEVHETNVSGALIGTGATDGAGSASFPVAIPASASGSYLLYICGLCTSEYPEWATRSFLVTGPAAPTTTTTSLATTTTAAAPTTLAPGTTVAAVTTAPASATPGVDSTAPTPAPENESSSRGLLIGAIAALAVMLAIIVGILIGSGGSTKGTAQPPPPPPPAP